MIDIDAFITWVTGIGDWIYLIVFAGMVLENALFLGIIIPGITILVFAGFMGFQGNAEIYLLLTVGFTGTFMGDQINFWFGRLGIERLQFVRNVFDDNPKVHTFIYDRPNWLYVFFHFPLYLRTIFPLILGAMRYPFYKWIVIDLIGAALFSSTFIYLGFLLAGVFTSLEEVTQIGNYIVFGFSALFLYWTYKLVLILIQSIRKRRSRDEH